MSGFRRRFRRHLIMTTSVYVAAAILGAVAGGVYGYYQTAPVETR